MDNVWSIAGHEIKTGEKKQVYVQVMDSEEYMPVTFINGKRDGKTVLVTSGIHLSLINILFLWTATFEEQHLN